MTKIKGIPAWEIYIEFVVLGVVALVALALVAMQFIGNPNSVEVRGKGTVAPGEINDLLRQEAQQLARKLDPDSPSPENIPDYEPMLARLQEKLESPVSPIRLVQLPQTHIPPGTGEHIRADALFVEPSAPTPEMVVASQYFDGLTEEVVSEHPDLREMLGEPPFDVMWNTVAAVYPSGEWLEALRAGGPDDDPAPVPQSWHNDRTTIVDVRVEREEYVNGSWSNRTLLSPIPGQVELRSELEAEIDASRRDEILRQLRNNTFQRELIQPEFFRTRSGSWMPPDPYAVDDPEDVGEEQLIRRLQRQLANAERQRGQVERDIDAATGGRTGDPGAGGGGMGTGSGSGGMGAGGMGAGGAGTGRDDRTPTRSEAHVNQLKQQLERIEARIRQLEAQLAELRPGEEFDPESLVIEEAEELLVWAHDLEIVRGSTYRYRVVVDLYNPFFARRLNLVEQQEHLADSFAIRSEASDWSEPIQVRPPVHTFVTRAHAPGQDRTVIGRSVDVGSATAEVFRFYDGRWWQERFNVEAGQRIGEQKRVRSEDGEEHLIDFTTDWYILDVVRDLDSDRDDGRAAKVVLADLMDATVQEIRHPNEDAESRLRRELRDAVELVAAR